MGGREEGGKIKNKPNVITKNKESNQKTQQSKTEKREEACEGGRGGGGGRKKNQTQAFITSCSGWKGKQIKDNRGGGRRAHAHAYKHRYIHSICTHTHL